MPLKVIGAGYGRTGTKSLQLALEALGYGKCYHMEELFRNPEHVKYWQQAHITGTTDWQQLFQNYQSAVDFPSALYYKQIANSFPDSKVILTYRDPEKWYESAYNTIYSFDPGLKLKLRLLFKMPFSATARDLFKVIKLNDKSLWKKHFDGKFEDKEYVIQKFRSHIEEVKQTIPEHRLLIFHPKDGWDPLCNFLGVNKPSSDFPSTNTRQNFHAWAKSIVKDVLS